MRLTYAFEAPSVRRVKIGSSIDPRSRFRQIAPMCAVDLVLRGVSLDDERRVHFEFAEHRLHGEWFAVAPEIEEWMQGLGNPGDPAEAAFAPPLVVIECAPQPEIIVTRKFDADQCGLCYGVATPETIAHCMAVGGRCLTGRRGQIVSKPCDQFGCPKV